MKNQKKEVGLVVSTLTFHVIVAGFDSQLSFLSLTSADAGSERLE